MLARAADRIQSFAPWPEGRAVLLACSGGADSTFLALAWRFASQNPSPSFPAALPEARVVVVDHGHRADSAADAAQAASLYQQLGFLTEVCRVERGGSSNESGLRKVRYATLLAAAERHHASRILLAHHADDCAETVLLRIFRGTGIAGLAGIPLRRKLTPQVELLRPMLELRAAAIRRTLNELGQSWVEDSTNANPKLAARNHLRHKVIPQLGPLATAEPTTALLHLAREAEDWRSARDELLDASSDFLALPSYFRRCAIQRQLQTLQETVSPARLRDLEGALLKHHRAGVDARRILVLRHGRLQVEST